jgi:hypothetical protein
MSDSTNVYAEILKFDDNGDGTLTVYGKATDDSLDIDEQICDPVWLDRAMPDWFRTGGNIREQHSNIAAGVAKEYESKADGHYISALVVDPVSVKKVQNRVLRGFSIGIKSPRVVRDTKAANGRIIDGQIVEVSLVDRPANPNCQLILAKSGIGEKTLLKTEELIEKYNEEHDESGRFGSGGGSSDKPERDSADTPRDPSVDREEADSADNNTRDPSIDENQDSMDFQEERGRNDGTVDNIADDLTDSQDEMDEMQADYEEQSEEDGADVDNIDAQQGIIEDSRSRMEEAQGLLDDATRPGSFTEHADLVESAAAKVESAINTLGYGDSQTQELQGNLRAVLGGLNNYLSGLDKSVTNNLSKTHSRDNKSATNKNKEPKMARQRRAAKSAIEKEVATDTETPMNGEAKAVPSRDEMIERYAGARKALDDITMECKSYGYDDIDKAYGETAEEESAEGPAGSGAEHEVGEAEGKKELVDSDGNETDKSPTLTEIIPDPSIETLPTVTEETIEEFVEDKCG